MYIYKKKNTHTHTHTQNTRQDVGNPTDPKYTPLTTFPRRAAIQTPGTAIRQTVRYLNDWASLSQTSTD